MARELFLLALLPRIRRSGRLALPVTYVGKSATFCLLWGFPLLLLGGLPDVRRRRPRLRLGVRALGDLPLLVGGHYATHSRRSHYARRRDDGDAMQAVVMAGGAGTRLRPLTTAVPKALLPIVGEPMLARVVRLLSQHGVDRCVVTLQHQASVVLKYFSADRVEGVGLRFLTEPRPLGTAGSVRYAQAWLEATTTSSSSRATASPT